MVSSPPKWPVGQERSQVGSINPFDTLCVKINFDDIDEVSRIDLVIFGDNGTSITRRLPCLDEIDILMTDSEVEFAGLNNASLYTVVAKLLDGSERIITKGRVNCPTAIQK